jgi:hypothetical protein
MRETYAVRFVTKITDRMKTALLIHWLVLSAIAGLVLLAPFVVSRETILRQTPQCWYKARHQKDCPACGMTRGFLEISDGNLRAAQASNRGSVPLFGLLAANELVVAGFLIRKIGLVKRARVWSARLGLKSRGG